MNYPRIILAGTNSAVGKTTLTLGIILALRKRGLKVQPFKAGPDYIDPTYHTQISGRFCRNLDSWLLSREVILELFERQAKIADISVIEGVMGLYDGLGDVEEGSTAHLAKLLACPVILVVDVYSMSRSAGAQVLGYREFDKRVNIAGVILNNVGSVTHYQNTKSVIEVKTKTPVLGFLPKDSTLRLPERHLGLIPTQEKKLVSAFCEKLLNLVEKNIDMDRIIRISRQTQGFPSGRKIIFSPKPVQNKITVAVARDEAFDFYYQDNLDILEYFGAKLVEFSPLRSKRLPRDIDGIYIGGGFPELFAPQLAGNTQLKNELYQRVKNGLPVYAECGGLMYLMEKLVDFHGEDFSMVGVFKGSVSMAKKLQFLGYVEVETLKNNILSKKGDRNKAHIFHWSYLKDIPDNVCFAYKIRNNKGVFYDGLIKENVLASYAHLHFASNVDFAKNFIRSCREYKKLGMKRSAYG
ncbi:MAG TPA: cobyrinate a,c-diamide synthase [Candidatus Aerophobetes bacterium]|uniref:Cobyrinate a,c-diamide synthase n=1 Tax=Aerophobetes bacterium TaxID=2030807 RepID=A0A7V0N1A0_UNCAE|nr:cobyrinate a,c-diamide synthase [Candidatus Aerophobetes bacterium]